MIRVGLELTVVTDPGLLYNISDNNPNWMIKQSMVYFDDSLHNLFWCIVLRLHHNTGTSVGQIIYASLKNLHKNFSLMYIYTFYHHCQNTIILQTVYLPVMIFKILKFIYKY